MAHDSIRKVNILKLMSAIGSKADLYFQDTNDNRIKYFIKYFFLSSQQLLAYR
jgi:hypothetical protein